MARRPRFDYLRRFIENESAGGIVLMASAALALIVANSPLAGGYFALLEAYVFNLSVLHWVNDALMAVFFLLVGLEIKRELILGQLATWRQRALPGLAAIGGMAVPAVIYLAFTWGDAAAMRGWAVPSATDIAFALGVLALLGSRVPISLKVFLTALAILDDLGAVVIIAAVYTTELSPPMLGLAALTFAVLAGMNASRVNVLWPYIVGGIVLWVFVFLSGVHATIAGVLLAATIPTRAAAGGGESPLHRLEHALMKWVAFAVLPVFGFANAGISLAGLSLAAAMNPVTLGSALGLFVGKQIGVFGGAWVAVKSGLGSAPEGASWMQVYGIAILCGIGFTMSLFIGLLAFETDAFHYATKLGVLAGSLVSAIVGMLFLRLAPAPAK